jgi:acyl transferase domain-containing protein
VSKGVSTVDRKTGIETDGRAYVTREPIAIVGIGCRFPGVHDADSFWKVLSEGRETVGDYPGGRFGYIDQVFATDSLFSSRIASRRGGFLSDIDRFDADFFGISPREAALLDPQQRLLLEVAWEAVDDAGLVREQLAGSRTGVFVGVWTSDYEDCMYEYSPDVDFHATTGGGRYGASGRLAYFLDVRGPNLTLDTACSSSLVAIHLACQSLLAGESSLALAGGVNAILRPEITLVYSNAGMLAPDGRCKFGDASADGYVRSEGAGIVALKRLSQAIADGDPIYAVIRGSAVNNDGRSSGLLVSPSREGQEDVIRTAMASAGMNSDMVDYVEAHGTGTLVGDPIEIETIGRVMTSETRVLPCAIGSVKTNIGHTESAAGVAGVIKVALALNHGVLPASLHFKNPSPQIAWDGLQVTVPTKAAPWPNAGRLPVAGVSGFGITGTNAHALLEAVERDGSLAVSNKQTSGQETWPYMFFLSAKTPTALSDVVTSWRELLVSDPVWPTTLADLSYTAGLRRTQHESRLVVTAADRTELDARLAAWLEGDERPGVVAGERFEKAPRKAVFIYPGQGGQWIGMGRTLYERAPVFRDALNRCDAAIQKHAGWSVVEELLASQERSRFQEIDVVQPTLFALMVALTELWRSLGVEPAAVVGHSMGEAAAAAVSGALSIDDAAAVICYRSRLMKRACGKGLMAVVELSLDDTRVAIKDAGRVWIGASNGATSTVVSGDADAVDALITIFEAREIFCRRIQVDVASHSGHMDEVRDELEAALAHIRPRLGTIPMYSTTTGEIEDGSRLDASYWGKNLRQPVLFHSAVEQLLCDEFDAFVEVNAHPVLTHAIAGSIQQTGHDAVVTGTLRRDSDDQLEILGAFGRLHVAGYSIDMRRVIPKGECIRLPAYPWQRERHWFEPPADATSKLQIFGVASGARNDAERVDPAECLYELEWVDAAQADSSQKTSVASKASQWAPTTRDWVVLSNERCGDHLAESLTALGHSCVTVRPGVGFKHIDAQTFEVNPTSVDDMQRLLRAHTTPGSGIIHAWSLTEGEALPDIDGILEAQSRGSLSAAALVRAVATLSLARPPRVWLITHGTQTVLNEPTATPWDASLIGFGRIAAAEHPEMPCTNLDLSAAPTDSELQFAAQLIARDVTEQQVAIRGARQFNARYRRARNTADSADTRAAHRPSSIRPDVTYVITGGLGGIGLLTARWLVDHGARYLALAGRRGPSEEAARTIAELEAAGAQVKIVAADIADPTQVTRLIETVESGMPPIAGVLHMAVVVDHALLRDATEESFRRVFGPKMIGAWNLYLALRDRSLDFCVLFSSMVDVIPQPRSASYASANAFLDGLARYGASSGMPIQSIQWEPWAGTGLMNEGKTKGALRMYEAQGVRPMSPALGFRILERALATPAPVLLAASVDWEMFASVCSADAGASEFLHLAQDAKTNKADKPASGTTAVESSTQEVRATLAALAAGRPRLSALELHLRDQLASVLKTSPDRLDLQKPMGNMGVDSLLALEFVRRLSRSLGVKVPATVVFNYPTIKKLTVLLESRMGFEDSGDTAIVATSIPPQPVQQSASDSDVDDMSDLDAIRALSGKNG